MDSTHNVNGRQSRYRVGVAGAVVAVIGAIIFLLRRRSKAGIGASREDRSREQLACARRVVRHFEEWLRQQGPL